MGTARQFNTGLAGNPSTMGHQLSEFYYQKLALIDLVKEQYFSQLADVTAMPKNMGKTIKRYLYVPMLDARNINDQGIDAAGVAMNVLNYEIYFTRLTGLRCTNANAATVVAAVNACVGATVTAAVGAADSFSAGFATVTLTGALRNVYATAVAADLVTSKVIGTKSSPLSGFLYSSSKDIGIVAGKMPALSETGGRVNRVGFTRKELTGTFEKFGFFDEYTQESMDFDSDAELMTHINRELLRGANEITEDKLQIDLINASTTVRFAGNATTNLTCGDDDLVDYGVIMRLGIDLDNNRTPKATNVITGSRMVDTRVIPAGRVMFIGSELLPTIKAMKDLHNNPAFISVEKYASAGATVTGEVGAIDAFRIVVVPEMMKWTGAGASIGSFTTFYDNGNNFDVFPMLVVGDGAFTTIGFQTDGNSVKFTVTHKAPGKETADRNDPYGESGFMSIKWYYGFMALRPERIGLIKTVAKL